MKGLRLVAALCVLLSGVVLAAPASAQQPLTASFDSIPDSHDGSSSFEVRIRFSERLKNARLGGKVVRVTNGDNTGSARVDGAGEVWEITIQPDGNDDVTIKLVAGDNDTCGSGLACTTDFRPLSEKLEDTVEGPTANPTEGDSEDDSDTDTPTAPTTTTTTAPSAPTSVPARPTGLTVATTHEAVTLTWDDPDDAHITGYLIHRRDPDDQWVRGFIVIDEVEPAGFTYTDVEVTPGMRPIYRVQAQNSIGKSIWSTWARTTVPAPPPEPEPEPTITVSKPQILDRTPNFDPPPSSDAEVVADFTFFVGLATDDGGSPINRHIHDHADSVRGFARHFNAHNYSDGTPRGRPDIEEFGVVQGGGQARIPTHEYRDRVMTRDGQIRFEMRGRDFYEIIYSDTDVYDGSGWGPRAKQHNDGPVFAINMNVAFENRQQGPGSDSLARNWRNTAGLKGIMSLRVTFPDHPGEEHWFDLDAGRSACMTGYQPPRFTGDDVEQTWPYPTAPNFAGKVGPWHTVMKPGGWDSNRGAINHYDGVICWANPGFASGRWDRNDKVRIRVYSDYPEVG